MVESQLCESCNVAMIKSDTIQSGNATYVRFLCPKCRAEKSICLGLNTKP